MNLAVIDPGVFVAGVFWRHEPHLCLKAWLHGMITPVMTEDMLAEYEVTRSGGSGGATVSETGAIVHDGCRAVAGCLDNVGLVG